MLDTRTAPEWEYENLGKIISKFLQAEKEDARNVFIRKYYFFDSISDIAGRYSFTESKVKNMLDADEYFDGSTAEWVIEKAKTNLPKFGSITMSNCQATLNTSNTWKNLNSLSGVKKIILTDSGSSSGTVLCSPGSISSNHKFTATWKAYN